MDEEATSIGVYLAILHGLERLIIADCGLSRPFSDATLVDAIIKLSIDRFVCSAHRLLLYFTDHSGPGPVFDGPGPGLEALAHPKQSMC